MDSYLRYVNKEERIFGKPPIGCVLDLAGRPFSGGIIKDNSPYGNNGTLGAGAATPTWVWGGQLWGLSLDATDDILTIPASPSLNIRDALTIEFWFKQTNQAINRGYLSKGGTNWLIYTNPADTIRWYIVPSGGAASVNTGTITLGQYYHFRATYDKDAGANNLNSYLNGVASTPATATGQLPDTSANDIIMGIVAAVVEAAGAEIYLYRVYNQIVLGHYDQERHLFL